MIKHFQRLYLLLGVVLFALILSEANISEAMIHLREVGWGILAILGIYLAAFVMDAVAWQITLPKVPITPLWSWRFWKIRMVGEAFNVTTPFATMGGEPVKAVILKRFYGISLRDGTASLVLSKTTFMIGLVIFLAIGFFFILETRHFSAPYKVTAGLGLTVFSAAILGLFLFQRLRITSRASRFFFRGRLGQKLEHLFQHFHAIEDRLITFYTEHSERLAASLGLSLANWLLGATELYVTFYFLGHPISFVDAWMIESMAQLVRAGTFFIPASIGAQDAAFVVLTSSLTGTPGLGVAVALIRRVREILWVGFGFAVGASYSLKFLSGEARRAKGALPPVDGGEA